MNYGCVCGFEGNEDVCLFCIKYLSDVDRRFIEKEVPYERRVAKKCIGSLSRI
jgi:hypothetical protein